MKKLIVILAIVLLLGLFYSFGKQIYSSLQTGSKLDKEVSDLAKLQKKNAELKKRLSEVQGVQFIESQARDKLGLSRARETVVIIPQEEIDKILQQSQIAKALVLPNWQAWLKLFFR
ncbi:septum formation initiator family protein [Candidatus Daviesbacteria bacterium]|nr:septum formation initiator family protein [Candidatus Daviesbacteria bacterium]